MNIKYRKRVLLVIGLLAIFIDLHITCFNHIMQDVFRYYADGYKLIVFFVEYWVVSSSAYLINIEDSKKLRFYVKPKFRFFGCIPVIVYGLYLVSKAGFLWDLVLFELHAIAFMLIATIDLWEESRKQTEQKV